MKKVFLSISVLSLMLTACKKDQASTDQPVNPSDPKALASAITVYHATTLSGALPDSTNDASAPVLNRATDNQQIYALNGRYAVIKPDLTSGDIAGCYLKITGSDSYYKIDFSKPRTGNRVADNTNSADNYGGIFNGLRTDGITGGYSDSSIIIELSSFVSSGNFSAEYKVYSSSNKVSNSIKVTVTVSQTSTSSSNSNEFVGDWKQTAFKSYLAGSDNEWKQQTNQKRYLAPTWYYCHNDHVFPTKDESWDNNYTIPNISSKYEWNLVEDLAFEANGHVSYHSQKEIGFVDFFNSTCSNILYAASDKDSYKSEYGGGFSYNSTTKKLICVFDGNGSGQPSVKSFDYTVVEKTATKFIVDNKAASQMIEFTKR